MPANIVKTPREERLWQKAKGIAEEAGHAEDWAYVTGVFKRMLPERFDKAAAFSTSRALYLREEAAKALQRPLPIGSKKREISTILHELLEFLAGKDFADKMADKVTQGILRAAPRTASLYEMIYDPELMDEYRGLSNASQEAAESFAKATEILHWLVEGLIDAKDGEEYEDPAVALSLSKKHVQEGISHLEEATRFERRLASRVASRHLTAYDPGKREQGGYIPGMVTQQAPYQGTGSQTPAPRDRDGKVLEVSGGGMMKIPGYEWHNRSEKFHRLAKK